MRNAARVRGSELSPPRILGVVLKKNPDNPNTKLFATDATESCPNLVQALVSLLLQFMKARGDKVFPFNQVTVTLDVKGGVASMQAPQPNAKTNIMIWSAPRSGWGWRKAVAPWRH